MKVVILLAAVLLALRLMRPIRLDADGSSQVAGGEERGGREKEVCA